MALYTGTTQGENEGAGVAYKVEIWVSDTQNGTYEYLTSVKAGAGDQVYLHRVPGYGVTRWYQLRYVNVRSGGSKGFTSAKKGSTSQAFTSVKPTSDITPKPLS